MGGDLGLVEPSRLIDAGGDDGPDGGEFSNAGNLRAEWTEPKSATGEQAPCCRAP